MHGRLATVRAPRAAVVVMAAALLGALAMSSIRAAETGPVATPATERSFQSAARTAQENLQQSLEELAELRAAIAAEKVPLNREIRRLEKRLVGLRAEHDEMGREIDTGKLDANNLRTETQARQAEKDYLSSLMDEYARNFESRLHIAELRRYRKAIDAARLAPARGDLSPAEMLQAQVGLVEISLDRLLDLLGGTRLAGPAVAPDGKLREVEMALLGPVALYSAGDGGSAGLLDQRVGSLEPQMVPLEQPELVAGARAVVEDGIGLLPLDPTLGNALKIEATEDTWFQQIAKGGPVMVPILAMGLAALLVAFGKWVQITRVRTPSRRRIDGLLTALRGGDADEIGRRAAVLPGPTGEMIRSGVEHIREPKDLVEEVMFEKLLETRLRLENWLPFVAMSASAAPLLGLLGTVTGMINTFKLITVYGSGDAQTLSSGISEALITTEFGLIVAIPSLLLYAYLSRRARRIVDHMEKTAVSFLNRVSLKPPISEEDSAGTPPLDGNGAGRPKPPVVEENHEGVAVGAVKVPPPPAQRWVSGKVS